MFEVVSSTRFSPAQKTSSVYTSLSVLMLFIATEDLLRFTATKMLFTRVNVAQAENLRVNSFIEYSNSRINATRYRSYANFLVLLGVLVNQASWSVLLSVEIIIKIILF